MAFGFLAFKKREFVFILILESALKAVFCNFASREIL